MPLPVLMMLAAAQLAPTAPITVTGHAWAPFISPMGEPFRARAASDDTLANWFYQADRNRDGVLTTDEMQADAARFFATLDTNHDGEIDPDEIAHYEWEIAPDIQVMSKTLRAQGEFVAKPQRPEGEQEHARRPGRDRPGRTEEDQAQLGMAGRLQGGARYGLLNMPEPVAAADTDFNRGISAAEFKQAAVERFQLLDSGHTGRLSLAQLETLRSSVLASGKRSKRDEKAADTRVGNPLPKNLIP
jgi:Ca2+-binding EF-hand superfamily protein